MARISKKQEMQDKLDRVAQVAEWFRIYAERANDDGDDDFADTMVIAAEWIELALRGDVSAEGLDARMYDGF